MSPPDSKHDEPHDPLDTLSEGPWAQVPELIRRDVEQHVLAHLPAVISALRNDTAGAVAPCHFRDCVRCVSIVVAN